MHTWKSARQVIGGCRDRDWSAALYLDAAGSPEQQQALGAVFSGHAGGPLAAITPLIGTVLGMKSLPIEYRNEGKKRSARIDGVLDANIQAVPAASPDAVVIKLNANPLFPGEE